MEIHGWSGGGGRVGLDVGSFAGFDPYAQARAWGGRQKNCFNSYNWAGPGTVWFKSALDTYGKLLIDSGVDDAEEKVPVTQLPELGEGTLAGLDAVGLDARASAAEAVSLLVSGSTRIQPLSPSISVRFARS